MTATPSDRHAPAAVAPRRFAPTFIAGAAMVALGGVVTARAQWASGVLPYDDAFITYRHVDNLVAGRGLVFNVGERVLGTSSPLYALLLAALKVASGRSTPELAVRFNVVPFVACGALVFALLRRMTGRDLLAGAVALLFLLDPLLASVAAGGMESYVFLALALGAMLAFASERGSPATAGALTGLALLTRPEGALLAPLALLVWSRDRRALARYAAAVAATTVPWVLAATAYYGSPVPMSVRAKSIPVFPLPPGSALSASLQRLEFWLVPAASPPWIARALAAIVLVAASVAAWWVPRLRARRCYLPAAFFWLVLGFYAVGNPMFFEWYLPALLAFPFAVLVVGASGLPPIGASGRITQGLTALALLWAAAATHARGRYVLVRAGEPMTFVSELASRARVIGYQRVARALRPRMGPSTTVISAEVGALGYYLPVRILDACGLVSPETHRYLPVSSDERVGPGVASISVRMVQDLRPTYVVSMPIFIARSLLRSPWFAGAYRPLLAVPLPRETWGDREIQVYVRRDTLGAAAEAMPPAAAFVLTPEAVLPLSSRGR